MLLVLVPLGANEPKRQAACVMARASGCGLVPHAQRPFLSRLFPATLFHNHPDQHTDCLTKPLTAARVDAGQKSVDGWHRF